MKLQVVFAWALALLIAVVQAQTYPWVERHDLTSADFQTAFDGLVADGYRLTYVSGYSLNNEARFAGVWEKKSSPSWIARIGLTGAKYQEYSDTYESEGYRVVIVNGYSVNDVNYYVAIWDKSPAGEWVAKVGLNASEYQSTFDTWVSQGFKLKHISAYSLETLPLFAAIWEETDDGIEWESKYELTTYEYQTALSTYVKQGYRLLLVSGCQINGAYSYAAIWDKSPSGRWAAVHELTSSAYKSTFDSFVTQGFTLKNVNGYGGGQSNQGNRYAAVWEQYH